jgi:hypothetical protein
LNTAYVRKFGWEAEALTPLPVEVASELESQR